MSWKVSLYLKWTKTNRIFEANGSFEAYFKDVSKDQSYDTIEMTETILNSPNDESYLKQIKSGRIFEANGSFEAYFKDVSKDQSSDTIEMT